MSVEWFVVRSTGVSGPYTAGKLKLLAEQGAIKPNDLIRKGSDGRAVPASRVGGLFPAATEANPPSLPSNLVPSHPNQTVPPATSRQSRRRQVARNLKFLFVGTPNTRPTIVMRLVRIAVWTASVIVGLFVLIFAVVLIALVTDTANRRPSVERVVPAQAANHDEAAPSGILGGMFRSKLKLAALRKVVAKYKQMPDPLDGTKVMVQFNNELEAIQNKFIEMPFDPIKDREQGKEIVKLYESEIERRYTGDLPRHLDAYIHDIALKMREE